MASYYESDDLKDFPKIAEYAASQGKAFFDYYGHVTQAGALTEREKSLIALAVALARQCPYCLDAYTNKCLSLGVSGDEMFEAMHVSAAITAGGMLAHGTQVRKTLKKKDI